MESVGRETRLPKSLSGGQSIQLRRSKTPLAVTTSCPESKSSDSTTKFFSCYTPAAPNFGRTHHNSSDFADKYRILCRAMALTQLISSSVVGNLEVIQKRAWSPKSRTLGT